MNKPTGEERRQAIRARRILSIQFRLVKSRRKNADTNWHLSTTHDMSILGISFLSDVPYQIDDVLELQVVMSGILDIFKGHGKVVRVEKKATGAAFMMAVKFIDKKESSSKAKKSAKTTPATKRK